MLLESQYSNAMQRYGKKRTYAILNQNKSLANRFLYKMYQFVYDEHVPVQDVILLFEHINALGLNMGIIYNNIHNFISTTIPLATTQRAAREKYKVTYTTE